MSYRKRRTVVVLWGIGVWIGLIVVAVGLMALVEVFELDQDEPFFGLMLVAAAIYLGWIPALAVVLGNWKSD